MSTATAADKAGESTRRVDRSGRTEARARTPAPVAASIGALQASAGNLAVSRVLGAGAPLPEGLRAEMERRFGAPFADVRIHDDPIAHGVAAAMNARALTQGRDVVFSHGRFAPASAEGRRLLAHELAHVVQQRRGGAVPAQPAGAFEQGLEAGADRAADAVASGTGQAHVSGASAPGITLSPELPSRDAGKAAPAAGGRQSGTRSNAASWREWLAQIESMEFDQAAGHYTISIDGELHALDERQYQENRSHAAAAMTGRIQRIRDGAADVDQASSGIREINQQLKYRPLVWLIEHYYGVEPPGDELHAAIVEAKAYAYQAEAALRKNEFLSALEHVESARVALERAIAALQTYYDGLQAASQSMADYILGKWGDLIQTLLGTAKGALTQVTDLADTAFWVADEARTQAGGSTLGLITQPPLMALALGHDAVKAMGMVDPSGRASTTASLSGAMDTASASVQQTLGSAAPADQFFTPYEIAELKGALGVQAVSALSGVKEVQLVFEVGGALQSLRTMVNTYRDTPDWISDTNFWSGVIGLVLSLVGLGHWSGTNKMAAFIVKRGWIASAAPPMVQFARDLENAEGLSDAERDRRLKEDFKKIAQALFSPMLEAAQQSHGGSSPDAGPLPSSRPDADARAAADAASGSEQLLPPGPGVDAGGPLPDRPDNVLQFVQPEPKPAPTPGAAGKGELIQGPWDDGPAPSEPDALPAETDARAEVDRAEESQLLMAVGYTGSATYPDPLQPSLVSNADAIVASTGGNDRDRPSNPSGGPPSDRPVESGPTERGAPTAKGSRVAVARAGRQLEILGSSDGKQSTLYQGEEVPPVLRENTEIGPGDVTPEESSAATARRFAETDPRPLDEIIAMGDWLETQPEGRPAGPARVGARDELAPNTPDPNDPVVADMSDAEILARNRLRGGEPSALPDYQLRDEVRPTADKAAAIRQAIQDAKAAAQRARREKERLAQERAADAQVDWPEEMAQEGRWDSRQSSESDAVEFAADPLEEPRAQPVPPRTAALEGEPKATARPADRGDAPSEETIGRTVDPDNASAERIARPAADLDKLPAETIAREALDPDDVPTEEMAHPALDPDDVPTEEVDPATEEITQPMVGPDNEPTEIALPAADHDDTTTAQVTRPTLVPLDEPSAPETGADAGAPAHSGHSEVSQSVAPDELERTRRQKKKRRRDPSQK